MISSFDDLRFLMARQRNRARKNTTRSANPRRIPITAPATCPADIWWPLEADNWTSDDTAEPEGDEVDSVEDTFRINGVPVDDERDCPDDLVVDGKEDVFEPASTVDAPEVKAEPEAEADNEEVEPAPASVTTKQSSVNTLGPTPLPTTS